MFTKFLTLILVLAFATGCGLRAQTYVMSKPRVGIEKGSGNAGYLTGTPVYVEPEKKTRKVYVLEITKAIPEGEVKKIEQEVSASTSTKTETVVPANEPTPEVVIPPAPKKIVIPKIEDGDPSNIQQSSKTPIEESTYTVLKDDTLQKIAKKHYGNYAAWLKIYNANKEKIKNPNLVKPGTVLTLPAEK